jgi:hypothetical protein
MLREAKATTLRKVLLARSCDMGGEDVVGEGVEEVGVGFACRGSRSRGDRRREIEVDPKRRGLRHDMSNLGAYFLY